MLCLKLLVLFSLCYQYGHSQDQCRTANGDAGSCILLENCDPLKKISEDDEANEDDQLFLSRSSCGLHLHIKPKVCCPPKNQWTDFTTTKPMTFPTGVVTAPTTKPPRVTTRAPRPPPGATIDKPWTCPATVRPPNPDSFCCGIDASTSEKIAGGKETAVEQYPWLALLEYEKTSRTHCGGSLISSKYVLTAAHCLGKTIYGEPTNVRLSEYNTSSYPTDTVEVSGEGLVVVTVVIITIDKQIPHPQYNRNSKGHYNDIGLIKLLYDAPYNNFIRPICLPVSDVPDYHEVDVHLIAAGWGSTGYEASEIKLHVNLPYIPLEECQKPYTKISGTIVLQDTQLCAGGERGKDSCGGDSGGPLMYPSGNTYVLQGIVSFGPVRCGTEGTPGIYTNVFKYLNWINREIV